MTFSSVAQVSVISFGAAPLGGVYGETHEELCIEAVHEAFKLGANTPTLQYDWIYQAQC